MLLAFCALLAAADTSTTTAPAEPTTAPTTTSTTTPTTEAPKTVAIGIRDVIATALGQALPVQQAENDIAFWQASAIARSAPFAPRLRVDTSYRYGSDPAVSPLYSFFFEHVAINSHNGTGYARLEGQMPWGTTYDVSTGFLLDVTDQRGVALSPRYRIPLEVLLTQPLLRGFGEVNEEELRRARARSSQSSAQLAFAREQAAFRAAMTYVALQVAEGVAANRTIARDLARSSLDATQRLIDAGRKPASEVHQQQINLKQRELALALAERDVERARFALAAVMNASPVAWVAAEPLNTALPRPAAADVVDAARANNPAVLAEARELALLEVDLDTKQNRALPDLRVTAGVAAIGDAGTSQCFDGYFIDGVTPCAVPPGLEGGPDKALQNLVFPQYGWASVGLRFEMPLDFGPVNADIDAAGLALARQRLEVAQAKNQAGLDAQSSLQTIAILESVLVAARDTVTAAAAGVVAAREGFEVGRTSVFDVIEAERVAEQTRQEQLGAEAQLATEQINLLVATGQLIPTLGPAPAP